MRKLLLASAATLGAVLASAGGAKAQPVKPVAPGTVVVHLNGYLQFEMAGFGSTYNNVTTSAGTFKLNPVTAVGDFRIYPGFDGQTTNGIDYGAQVELRTAFSDAGVGAGKTTGTGGSAGTTSLYVKRAYGYVGAPEAGFLRFGQGDGAFTLLQSGVIEAFGDGSQWTGEGTLVSALPTAASPGNFIYADQAGLYATDKVVYITPSIAGLSGAVSYEPNSNGLKEGDGSCAIAGSGCGDESSSPTPGDAGKRRKNTIDGMLSYTFKGDGMLVKASAGYLYGATVNYDGPLTAVGTVTNQGYDTLGVYQAGAQITFAGLTLGANLKGGQTLDSYAFKPRGARDAFSYILGASYVIGPWVLGASYYNTQSAGAYVPGAAAPVTGGRTIARTLSEYGVAVGGNYVFNPHFSLFLQYLYGHRHQPGNPFGGTTTVGAIKVANGSVGNAQVQAIGAGGTFKW